MVDTTHGVVGTDGVKPIVDNEPLWRQWHIDQMWLGEIGAGKYVPKIKDHVLMDTQSLTWAEVTHIDPFTLIPTLTIIVPKIPGYFSSVDAMTTDGPGTPSETFRIYMNTRVYPYTLQVDSGVYIRGSLASYAKIFQGTDITETGKVLSRIYDSSNNFVGVAVPLEMAALDSHTNYVTKVVKPCHCIDVLPNDELVTLVVYNDQGGVIYKRQMYIEITDTIADTHGPIKYVKEIGLKSIWLSDTQPDLLVYPLNIPMDSLNLTGVVTYSDGTTLELPVDGSKFAMLGLDGRLSSIPEHGSPLTLRYTFSGNEIGASSAGANNGFMTKPYRIINGSPNKGVAVKLFGYPDWISEAVGYRMQWWLLNAERNIWFNVTDKVNFNALTGAFEPKLFGVLQRKSVSINLRDVSISFLPFNHTQVVDIVLSSKPSPDKLSNWSVGTEASDIYPRVGISTYGRIVEDKVNFGSDCIDMEDWLDKLYWKARPIVNKDEESNAPKPTHFAVHFNGNVIEYPVTDWNKDLTIGAALAFGRNAYLRFFRREVTGDLQLAVTAVILKNIIF